MGKFVWDSFSGVSGLKTALVKIRTVLSHSEAVKRLQKHFVNMRSTNHMERSHIVPNWVLDMLYLAGSLPSSHFIHLPGSEGI